MSWHHAVVLWSQVTQVQVCHNSVPLPTPRPITLGKRFATVMGIYQLTLNHLNHWHLWCVLCCLCAANLCVHVQVCVMCVTCHVLSTSLTPNSMLASLALLTKPMPFNFGKLMFSSCSSSKIQASYNYQDDVTTLKICMVPWRDEQDLSASALSQHLNIHGPWLLVCIAAWLGVLWPSMHLI